MSKYIFILFKLVLFLVVVWLLTRNINLPDLMLTIRKFSITSILGVVACLILRIVFLAVRMKYAAQVVAGIMLRFGKLVKWEFEILFLEVIIPLPDAEDMFRGLLWQKEGASVTGTLTALLFSRICGVLAVFLLLPFTFLMLGPGFENYFPVATKFAWVLPLVILGGALMHKKMLGFFAAILRKIKYIPRQIVATIERVAASDISMFKYATGILAAYLQLGFIALGFFILTFNSGIGITYLQLFLLTPVLLLAFTLPLSLQGLGLPETAMIWLLQYLGAGKEISIAIGIVHFGGYILIILAGGVLALVFSKNRIADFKNVVTAFKNRISPTFKAG